MTFALIFSTFAFLSWAFIRGATCPDDAGVLKQPEYILQ